MDKHIIIGIYVTDRLKKAALPFLGTDSLCFQGRHTACLLHYRSLHLETEEPKKADEVQRLFSQYGCHIKTRLGLHEVQNVCSRNPALATDWSKLNSMAKTLSVMSSKPSLPPSKALKYRKWSSSTRELAEAFRA